MGTESKPWYMRPIARWGTIRDVPFNRLWSLFLAVFLLFSVIGYYTDLLNEGNSPYLVVFLIAAYSGLNACLWLYATSRLPAYFVIALAVLQFFNSAILNAISVRLIAHFDLHLVPGRQGIHFAATAIFLSIIASYVCFVRFIRSEGKESIRLQSQLELAQDMHKTLVPTIQFRNAHFEIYGISHPSEKVGGDLVDAVPLPSGDVFAYLADVSGHGLPASILMGRVKTATRTAVLEVSNLKSQAMLPVLLQRLNTVLPQVKEPNFYATFSGFRLAVDGAVSFALAASPPLLLWSALNGAVTQLDKPQLPLGLLPVDHFDSVDIQTTPGDLLVVVTDGLLEVAGKGGEEFGAERLKTLLASRPQADLPELAATILASVRSFGNQFDDQTMLLIRCL